MKKKLITSFFAAVLCTMYLTGCGVEQTSDSVTVEAGQKLDLKAQDFFNIKEDKAGEVKFDTSEVDMGTPGEYEVTVEYGKKKYTIKVSVVDTTSPSVGMKQRYGFTNDISSYDAMQLIASIYDASEYTVKLVRFEGAGKLSIMDEASLKKLSDSIPIPADQEKLAALGKEGIPTEEGLYRAVLEVKDSLGNMQLEEVYIILDKTGALIDDVTDKTVEQEDLSKNPEVNPADYVITDNVDGVILSKNVITKLSLTDEASHRYTVHVSYVDRAGNESAAEFVILVTSPTGDSNNASSNGEKEDSAGKNDSDIKKSDSGSGKGSADDNNNADGSSGNSGNSDENTNSGGASEGGSGGNQSADDGSSEPEREKPSVSMYAVMSGNGGGYRIYVDGGDEGTGYQMLADYLETMGCGYISLGGGWYDISQNIYECYVSGSEIYSLEE